MYCPLCGARLSNRELVNHNSQGPSGGVEFDVACPHCLEGIGRMIWGELVLNPNLFAPSREAIKPVLKKEPLIPPPPELRPLVRMRGRTGRKPETPPSPEAEAPAEEPAEPQDETAEQAGQQEPVVCPHCGKPIE